MENGVLLLTEAADEFSSQLEAMIEVISNVENITKKCAKI